MSTEPGSFTSNGSMIVVSNRLPFVLKRNNRTGELERKARLVYLIPLLKQDRTSAILLNWMHFILSALRLQRYFALIFFFTDFFCIEKKNDYMSHHLTIIYDIL